MPQLEISSARQCAFVELSTGVWQDASGEPIEVPCLPESLEVGFRVIGADREQDYRIRIGDVPLGDIAAQSGGRPAWYGPDLRWPDDWYLDSARGDTPVTVESRVGDTGGPWQPVGQCRLQVTPSKLSDDAYESMTRELEALTPDLLLDLYGKSWRRHERLLAASARPTLTHDAELNLLDAVVQRLTHLLAAIGQRPASAIRAVPSRATYWGEQAVGWRDARTLARRGIDLASAPRPVHWPQQRLQEVFDVPEHRTILFFLKWLVARARRCAAAARAQSRGILEHRSWRDRPDRDEASLFEVQDRPRLARLRQLEDRAHQVAERCEALQRLPFLEGLPAEVHAARAGVFTRSSDYRAIAALMQRFAYLGGTLSSAGSRGDSVAKMTWRLFEQWCFLNVIDSFRRAGLQLEPWEEALHPHLRSHFVMDFGRGLGFQGLAPDQQTRVRIRYEPWVMPEEAALASGESVFRGRRGETAWSPDILIECQRMLDFEWRTVYAIVMDCKYSRAIREHHWHDVLKYDQIRQLHGSCSQVVGQLWLIHPGAAERIEPQDDVVQFSAEGPTCGPTERASFTMTVAPARTADDDQTTSILRCFAEGTLAYIDAAFAKP